MKILLICKDTVGAKMAGPGIRYFEMAKFLSQKYQVTLAAPKPLEKIHGINFTILPYKKTQETNELRNTIAKFDVIIAQFLKPRLLKIIKKAGAKYVADLYDPLIIETLEHFKHSTPKIQAVNFDFQRYLTLLQIAYADLILCASKKQADYYVGLLSALGKLNETTHKIDSTLSNLLMIVPFGIEGKEQIINCHSELVSESPVHTLGSRNKPAQYHDTGFGMTNSDTTLIQKMIPNYSKEDKVIIWAGGVWNWFDPLSAIKAVADVSETDKSVKLLFMGLKHPNPDIPEMSMASRALELAEKLGVLNKQIFLNHDWVAYKDRHQLLNNSYLGISTHFKDLETRFSFRTRILDYIGHGLPVIATEGDSMSELVKERGLGIVVGYEKVDEIEKAIHRLLDRDFYSICQKNLAEVKKDYLWSNLLKPLSDFIDQDRFIKNKPASYFEANRLTYKFYQTALKRILAVKGVGGILAKLFGK